MTETDIIKVLAGATDHRLYPYMCQNIFIYAWECDYWTMTKGGETREFEIKISRHDYFNDAKKDKHKTESGANFFYYVVPEGLIQKEEVNSKYGLIYVTEAGSLYFVKKPKRLHSNKFENWKMLANRMYWRFYQLWKQKWVDKEITRDEFYAAFAIDLSTEEPVK
jgi:hypothetical protein